MQTETLSLQKIRTDKQALNEREQLLQKKVISLDNKNQENQAIAAGIAISGDLQKITLLPRMAGLFAGRRRLIEKIDFEIVSLEKEAEELTTIEQTALVNHAIQHESDLEKRRQILEQLEQQNVYGSEVLEPLKTKIIDAAGEIGIDPDLKQGYKLLGEKIAQEKLQSQKIEQEPTIKNQPNGQIIDEPPITLNKSETDTRQDTDSPLIETNRPVISMITSTEPSEPQTPDTTLEVPKVTVEVKSDGYYINGQKIPFTEVEEKIISTIIQLDGPDGGHILSSKVSEIVFHNPKASETNIGSYMASIRKKILDLTNGIDILNSVRGRDARYGFKDNVEFTYPPEKLTLSPAAENLASPHSVEHTPTEAALISTEAMFDPTTPINPLEAGVLSAVVRHYAGSQLIITTPEQTTKAIIFLQEDRLREEVLLTAQGLGYYLRTQPGWYETTIGQYIQYRRQLVEKIKVLMKSENIDQDLTKQTEGVKSILENVYLLHQDEIASIIERIASAEEDERLIGEFNKFTRADEGVNIDPYAQIKQFQTQAEEKSGEKEKKTGIEIRYTQQNPNQDLKTDLTNFIDHLIAQNPPQILSQRQVSLFYTGVTQTFMDRCIEKKWITADRENSSYKFSASQAAVLGFLDQYMHQGANLQPGMVQDLTKIAEQIYQSRLEEYQKRPE